MGKKEFDEEYYFEKVSKKLDEIEKHLDAIFDEGKKQGLDPYSKPASKWLMKKRWRYDKEERKAYNLGYKYGNTEFNKEVYK